MGGFGLDIVAQSKRPSLSVRFNADLKPTFSGDYEFEIFSIGPSRILIDGEIIVDNWTSQDPGETFFAMGSAPRRGNFKFNEGSTYKLEVEYKWEGRFPAVQIGMKAPDQHDLMQEAIDMAQSETPDVILMDMGLPVKDGLQATKEIKENSDTANIPVIALTANAMAEHRQEALDGGCDEYETKPVRLPSLLEKIEQFT